MKYSLNESSNPSLNINKSELDLISSKDYNKSNYEERDVDCALKESNGLPSLRQMENNSQNISMDKEMPNFKDMFTPQMSNKNSQISKLIEQEKQRRRVDPVFGSKADKKCAKKNNFNKEKVTKERQVVLNKIDLADGRICINLLYERFLT